MSLSCGNGARAKSLDYCELKCSSDSLDYCELKCSSDKNHELTNGFRGTQQANVPFHIYR